MYLPCEVRTYCCRPDLVTLTFRPRSHYQRDWILSLSHIRLIMVDGLTDYHIKQSQDSHPQRWQQPFSSTTLLETFFTAGIYFYGSSVLNKFTFMQLGSLAKPAGGRVPGYCLICCVGASSEKEAVSSTVSDWHSVHILTTWKDYD